MTVKKRKKLKAFNFNKFNIYTHPIDSCLHLWFMSCYLYYERAVNVLNDYQHDEISRRIYDEWDDIHHSYKDYVDRERFKSSSTGLGISYPVNLREDALDWFHQWEQFCAENGMEPQHLDEEQINLIGERQ